MFSSRRQLSRPWTRITVGPVSSSPGIHQARSTRSGTRASREANSTSRGAGMEYGSTSAADSPSMVNDSGVSAASWVWHTPETALSSS